MTKTKRLGKVWCVPDPEDPTYEVVVYSKPVSERKAQDRSDKAQDLADMEADIMADPMTAYLYLKQQEDSRTARRLLKDPRYWNRSFSDMLSYVQSITGNDDMPVVIRKGPNSEGFNAHDTLKTIKGEYRKTAKERRQARKIELNAEAGMYQTQRWDDDFIEQVIGIRTRRGMNQRDLAMMMNVTEGDIQHFERGELQYNAGLRAKFMWKLGMA